MKRWIAGIAVVVAWVQASSITAAINIVNN